MGRAPRGSRGGYWWAPCSPTSGKSTHCVLVARAGGCKALSVCVPCMHCDVPTGCHGVSTSLLTQHEHLQICVCAHHAVHPAVHVTCAHICAHTCAQAHVHGVLACWQPCQRLPLGVHTLRARTKPWSAGTPGCSPGSWCAPHHSQSQHARAGFLPAFVFCNCQSPGGRWEQA